MGFCQLGKLLGACGRFYLRVLGDISRVSRFKRPQSQFRDDAPMTASEAATVILDGVREERWRILVGKDADVLDRMVRETPEEAYDQSFMDRLVQASGGAIGS